MLAWESELGPPAFSHDMLSHCIMLSCLSHMLPRAFMNMQHMPARNSTRQQDTPHLCSLLLSIYMLYQELSCAGIFSRQA